MLRQHLFHVSERLTVVHAAASAALRFLAAHLHLRELAGVTVALAGSQHRVHLVNVSTLIHGVLRRCLRAAHQGDVPHQLVWLESENLGVAFLVGFFRKDLAIVARHKHHSARKQLIHRRVKAGPVVHAQRVHRHMGSLLLLRLIELNNPQIVLTTPLALVVRQRIAGVFQLQGAELDTLLHALPAKRVCLVSKIKIKAPGVHVQRVRLAIHIHLIAAHGEIFVLALVATMQIQSLQHAGANAGCWKCLLHSHQCMPPY